MEETSYWMWTRSKLGETTPQVLQTRSAHVHFPAATTTEPSWEEQAFAEDSAGLLLGGCVWPPRSYSCNFCRREFRSAQALGGHMNVHRRDRARLKQSSPTSPHHQNNNMNGDIPQHQTNNHFIQRTQNPLSHVESSSHLQPDHQVHRSSLVFRNLDPNSYNPSFVSSSSLPLSPDPRVTLAATIQSSQNNCVKQTLILPPHSAPIVDQASNHRKGSSLFSTPSDSFASRLVIISDSNLEEEKGLNKQGKETGLKVNQEEYYDLNSSAMKTFDMLSNRSWPKGSADDDEVGRDTISKKRRRNDVDDTSYLPFFLKPILGDRRHRLESNELLGLNLNQTCSKEELDLELRL